jgi:hypothetical protein
VQARGVFAGEPEQSGDHAKRERIGERLVEVAGAVVDEGVDELVGDAADGRLERSDTTR